MGIVVVRNPIHLGGVNVDPDLHGVFERTKAQPLRSLLAAGIPVAILAGRRHSRCNRFGWADKTPL